uniref:ATP synthase complex subunit 8 n=1 Tax=Callionymus reticulatus TaxID=508552 RepID=A0A7G8QC20_9TELE|nr:ATP synthase F0 subunit 8 [Callionymus reticulatus]
MPQLERSRWFKYFFMVWTIFLITAPLWLTQKTQAFNLNQTSKKQEKLSSPWAWPW